MDSTAPARTDDEIADQIRGLLARRAADRTICPSDVARALAKDEADWRALMPDIRRVAAGMAANRSLRVTRKGVEVDAMDEGGPIRLGRPVRPVR